MSVCYVSVSIRLLHIKHMLLAFVLGKIADAVLFYLGTLLGSFVF